MGKVSANILTCLILLGGLGLASSQAATPTTLPPFSNRDVIVFPELDDGPASPYPSTVVVSGQTRAISKVTVTLFNLRHVYPDDIDVLLVGPGGQKIYLMSDTGLDTAISGIDLTFDDTAAQSLPDSNPLVTGTYRPTNFGANDPFNLPAPAPPYATNLAVFNQTNPNGVWSLYVMDDLPEDSGFFDGWQMTLTVLESLADVALGSTTQPAVGLAGSNMTFIVSVTNRGPASATGVLLTGPLPANATYVSAVPTQGTCTQNGVSLSCDLGTIASQARLEMRLVVAPLLGGTVTNTMQVTANELDLVPANNTTTSGATVLPATDLAVATRASTASILHGENFTYTLGVTNLGPDTASGVRLTSTLDTHASYVTSSTTQGGCSHSGGVVTCVLGNLPSGGFALIDITAQATAPGTLTQSAQVTGDQTDPRLANNTATASTVAGASADLAVRPPNLGSILPLGNPIPYTVTITNQGPSLSQSALFTHAYTGPVTFVSAQSSQATCTNENSVIYCALNPLPAGQAALIDIIAIASGTGPVTNTIQVAGSAVDLNPGNNQTIKTATVAILTGPYANPNPVTLLKEGPAQPYPSTIEVAGLTASVLNISVTLSNLTHSFPDDLDVLLVGPGGQASFLMADTGGGNSIEHVTLTFDQRAGSFLPNATLIESGVYSPTVYGPLTSTFPPPAPSGPYSESLAVFNGTNPNGTWSLYVVDDRPLDEGILAGGWSLSLATLDPIADVALAALVQPNPVPPGALLNFSVTVTNRGPATSTEVVLETHVPPGLSWSSTHPSQGGCSPPSQNGTIRCDLGTLPAGVAAIVTFINQVEVSGPLTQSFQVFSRETDLVPGNNAAQASATAGVPINFVDQPESVQVRRGSNVHLSALASGTNPTYQWLFNGTPLAGATMNTLDLTNIQFEQAGAYRVAASNLLGGLLSQPAQVIVIDLPDVITLSVSGLASTGVVLRASVNPNFGMTIAWLEWGSTPGYGRVTAPRVLGQGGESVDLAEGLTGLEANTTYHYRAVAANQLGLVSGLDRSFSWSTSPPTFDGLTVLPDASVQLDLLGNRSQTYFIEGSSNLIIWELLGPAEESTAGRFGYRDASHIAPRFYRIFSP